jgi:hypothetical protein
LFGRGEVRFDPLRSAYDEYIMQPDAGPVNGNFRLSGFAA